MSWLEDGIAALSPRWAARRAFYRAQLDLARAYDGAKGGRRQSGWSRPSTSASAEIATAGGKLRDSARDLVRNNPYIKRAKRQYIADMVRTGIRPRANTGSKARDRRINAAWDDWQAQADADGRLDFYGLQGLITGTIWESGEALVRFRDRLPQDGLRVPMQLQVLEPDYLDVARWGQPAAGGANWINQGIEFDQLGRRVAYYLFSQHPGDSAIVRLGQILVSSRVPAEQIAHVYRVDRAGQVRGVTELAAAMQRTYDLADFDEAELVRKKIAACFAAFIKRSGAATSPLAGTRAASDAAGRRIETMSPGIIQYLGLDEEAQFAAPPGSENYRDYVGAQLHAIAAGVNSTYEAMTGDWGQVNYSSFRAGQNGYRALVEMDQWLILVPQFCDPSWRRFVDRLVIAGEIDRPAYGVKWETPALPSINPREDALADQAEVRSGFATLSQKIAQRGYDPDEVLEERAADDKRLDELGLVLDSDPRKVASSGAAQGKTGAEADAGGGNTSNGGKGNGNNAQG